MSENEDKNENLGASSLDDVKPKIKLEESQSQLDEDEKLSFMELLCPDYVKCNIKIDPSLDIKSEQFDPLKMLYGDLDETPSTSNAATGSEFKKEKKFDPLEILYAKSKKCKKVAKYDNIAAFEVALKKFGVQNVGAPANTKNRSESSSKTQPKPSTSGDLLSGRNFKEHQMPIKGPGMKQRHTRNIFKHMEECIEGPVSFLSKMKNSRTKIKVYTRKEHGIRGYTTGYIIAFDKHMNLLLEDVCEIWKRRKYKFSWNGASLGEPSDCSRRLRKLGIKLPEMEVKSLDRKYVEIKRNMSQLLIRGEQVALVCAADTDKKLTIKQEL